MGHGGKRSGAGRPRTKPQPVKKLRPAFAIVEGGAGEPGEPDWSLIYSDDLDIKIARHWWGVIVRELRDADKLATANEHQVKRLVDHYVTYEQAARHVAEEGAVIKGKRGATRFNPWFRVMKDANAMASTAEAELTISPRRRNNGGKVKPKANKATGGRYLKPVAG